MKPVLMRLVILYFMLLWSSALCSQKDTVSQKDTTVVEDTLHDQQFFFDDGDHHSVSKATIFSALLPGLGQAYNRKWWKIPIVYAGLGASGYFMINNQIKQKTYKEQIKKRIDDPTYQFPDGLDSLAVLQRQRQFQSRRDLFIFVTLGVYVINIVDAAVDAQLFTFDISRDLSLRWSPQYRNRSLGLGFQFLFKNKRQKAEIHSFE